MKQSVTYACGHTGIEILYGRYADRERRIAWLEGCLCPECKEAKKKEEAAKLAEEAKENGLPALTGTEKQITWAEQIRASFFRRADSERANDLAELEELKASGETDIPDYSADLKRWDDAVAYIAENMNVSSWWIDNRRLEPYEIINKVAEEISVSNPVEDDQSAIAEATMTPENEEHGGTVEITVTDDLVTVKYVKDDDFRKIIKDLDYRWDPDARLWSRSISYYNGTAVDRAAETTNTLLREGFTVRCFNDDVRRIALDASFQPEQKKWVFARARGEYQDWFAISFPRGDQGSYDAAHNIKGARWSNPSIVVPAQYYELVLDFAEVNGFSIGRSARKLMLEQEKLRRNAVTPATPVQPEENDLLQRILATSGEILDDLKDD